MAQRRRGPDRHAGFRGELADAPRHCSQGNEPWPGRPALRSIRRGSPRGRRRIARCPGNRSDERCGSVTRLNCQACHRAEGPGTPPEIHSLLAPVQGASVSLVRTRLRQQSGQRRNRWRALRHVVPRGHTRTHAQRRASHATAGLSAGRRHGFAVRVPAGACRSAEGKRQSTHEVSWARRGELVVKGTCHICHDAVGPPPATRRDCAGLYPRWNP